MPVIPPGQPRVAAAQLPAPAARASASSRPTRDRRPQGPRALLRPDAVARRRGRQGARRPWPAARSPTTPSSIYTTDHGENMGEHGLWWKNCMYEHAARVPLIVSLARRDGPGGQRRAGACSLVDVVQTIAELGGADAPDDWDGDSLCALAGRRRSRVEGPRRQRILRPQHRSGYAMLRPGRYKYVYHTPADAEHPAERELYDLEADPGEFTQPGRRAGPARRASQQHARRAGQGARRGSRTRPNSAAAPTTPAATGGRRRPHSQSDGPLAERPEPTD